MLKTPRLVATACLLILIGAPTRAEDMKESKKIRVLLVDGQNNHNWKATTPIMKKALEDCGRFTVEVATSPPKPNAKDADAVAKYKEAMAKFRPDLSKCDVVLSNYNGDPWSQDFQKDLETALKEGKVHLVIVHAANNAFSNWPEWNMMIGMGWRGNNFGDRLTLDADNKEKRVPKGTGPGAGHGAQHSFKIVIRDADHPITKGMPMEWMHAQDELYHGMRGPIQNVHLLATAFDDKSKGGTGEQEPMIWTVTYGKGRVFHTPMGHAEPAMHCWGFIGTLRRGTEWAATGTVTQELPKEFPTAEKTSSLSAK